MKNSIEVSQNIKDFSLPTPYQIWRKNILQDELLSQKISLKFFISDLEAAKILKLKRYKHNLGKLGCEIIDNNKLLARVDSYRHKSNFSILLNECLFRFKEFYEKQ